VPELPPNRPVVAVFDVDGTLTTEDCVVPFLRRAAGGRKLALALLRHPLTLAGALVHRDRDGLKELATGSLAGKEADELDRLGASFARDFVTPRLRDDTTARLHRHKELGHAILLASASYEAYLVPLGAHLEVDGVVCTRLERDAGGRLTGRLLGANCRGPEKARRVREWLGEARLGEAEIWAYGDSPGDAEMLAAADHPVRVDGVSVEPNPG
jgi:phosphatidylglycerophosphatase C